MGTSDRFRLETPLPMKKRVLRLRFATLRMNGELRFATLGTNGAIAQGFP